MPRREYSVGSPSSREIILTPTDSDDGSSAAYSPLRLDKTHKSYRMFNFRKTGAQWRDGAEFAELSLSEVEIKDRIEKPSKTKPSISARIRGMSEGRRDAINALMAQLYTTGLPDDDWSIVTIKDNIVQVPNKQADVRAFSVIVKRDKVSKPRSKPYVSDGPKRSSFVSSGTHHSAARTDHRNLRASATYDPASVHSRGHSESPTSSASGKQAHRYSQPVIDDDPFAVTPVFSPHGRPLDLHGNPIDERHGLPPPIPRLPSTGVVADGPVDGANHTGSTHRTTKNKNRSNLQALADLGIETQFANTNLGGVDQDLVDGEFSPDTLAGDYDPFVVVGSPDGGVQEEHIIDVGDVHYKNRRGHDKRRDSGYANAHPQPKSKSRPHISLDIPTTSAHKHRQSILQPASSISKRRSKTLYVSPTVEDYIVELDSPPIEVEHEDYLSPGSSADQYVPPHDRYRSAYAQPDGRYHRNTSVAYATRGERPLRHSEEHSYNTHLLRPDLRPRTERLIEDSYPRAYHYTNPPSESRRTRPLVISHSTSPFDSNDFQPPRGSPEGDGAVLLYYPGETISRERYNYDPHPPRDVAIRHHLALQDEHARVRQPRTHEREREYYRDHDGDRDELDQQYYHSGSRGRIYVSGAQSQSRPRASVNVRFTTAAADREGPAQRRYNQEYRQDQTHGHGHGDEHDHIYNLDLPRIYRNGNGNGNGRLRPKYAEPDPYHH